MEWNLNLCDLERIVDNFLKNRSQKKYLQKDSGCFGGVNFLKRYWRDTTPDWYFGQLHIIKVQITYVENMFLIVSIYGGEHSRYLEKNDREYVLEYLNPLFVELEPHIGLPTAELETIYPIDQSYEHVDFEWKNDATSTDQIADAYKLIFDYRTILSSKKFAS